MKKYMICALLFLLVFISFNASAQYGRGNGRYNNRYAPYHRYPSRTSVSIIARLPFGAVGVTFGDRRYHYYNGTYYRPYSRGYYIVQPPVGIIVPAIPYGASHVIIGANPYYRHGNVYYAPYGNRYRVVDEPAEDYDESINDNVVAGEYEKIVIEGKTYYKKGDKYYKASVNKSGEVIYEEVGETTKSE
jgi:hypothetical protein